MEPAEIYERNVSRYRQDVEKALRRSGQLSNLRLLAFGTALAFGVAGTLVNPASYGWILTWYLLAAIALAWFIRLIVAHRKIIDQQIQLTQLLRLNENALHRLNREWKLFPVPPAPEEFASQNTARDLDVFGFASLFHLVCTHQTPQGRHTLARWFCEPAEPGKLRRRQQSVEALAPELSWRQQLSALGANLGNGDASELVPRWSRTDPWFHSLPVWFPVYLKWCPWLFFLLLAPLFFVSSFPFFLPILAINLYFLRKYRIKLQETLKNIGAEDRQWRCYAQVFRYLEECPAFGGTLGSLKKKVSAAASAMDELNNLATAALARGSIVHPLLNLVAAWDFRVVRALENWQQRHGTSAEKWFASLGEFEALASLASLRFDEPQWQFPVFFQGNTVYSAKSLGHPLIAREKRVSNPIHIGPGGRFLLVTGSNMSGKSTLLRSIGLNLTLGQTGAPCCAEDLSFSKLALATSMRVEDSLSEGLSFFMAELQRIKQVVLIARESQTRDRKVLFLLDEILQGTNTVERREIVRRVVALLTDCGAIGAITTHDLALAEMDDLADHSDLIHFSEDFSRDSEGKPKMTFDYRLREGIATTTNALKILEVIEMPV